MISDGLYRALRALLRGFFAVFLPFRACGAEQVPDTGAVILCANHQSFADPVLLCLALRRRICFMAKRELFDVPLLGRFIRALGGFSVERGAGDLKAVRLSLSILGEGRVMGIFPQGTRTFKGTTRFQTGAALIALRSGAPVIPVYIDRRARLFRRVSLRFGAPVDLSACQGRMNSETLTQATRLLEQAVYGEGVQEA